MSSKYEKMLMELNESFRDLSSGFYHSTPLVQYEKYDLSFDLRDVLLTCAISGSNVLLTSRTGSGKTMLAKMLMKSLFGEDYAFLQVDTKLDENKLRDIAFSDIKEGKHLHEALRETKFLTSPGVILDEYNRAPPLLLNLLQGYLTNGTIVFEGGREFEPGVPVEDSEGVIRRYQLKVATMNEGEEYRGTQLIDKAARDRFPVEINLDIFEPSPEDKRELIKKGPAKLTKAGNNNLEKVLELYRKVNDIPLSGQAEEFILYFMRMNQCIKSPEGTKLTLFGFNPEYCKGCSASARDKEICGNVIAPSERTISNWTNLSKAFALYRKFKFGKGDEVVELEDVKASAPFVLYSKMDIKPGWIAKYARRSLWCAVNEVINISYDRWLTGVKENEDLIERDVKGQTKPEDEEAKVKYCEKDPWFFGPDVVKRVIEMRRRCRG